MKQKALFLDRDGIINIDHGYVCKQEGFEFSDGIFELVKHFSDAGYLIFVVTNQSGIGRGYYTEEDFVKLSSWMIRVFQDHGIEISQVYHCPHLPDAGCRCRKPAPGMIEDAAKAYDIDLSASWMIGDKQSDIDLAHNAGIGRSIAIGQGDIKNATFSFDSVAQCSKHLPSNV